ncbi:integrase core domain-containing protein [Stenotrophomonas terrae]|uniref:integrase core domain-containing protein n=1 Tax=Stenotrophomonas terrae TaxID=405446 RepID=UPI003CCCA971
MEPGRPMHSRFIERFNGRGCRHVLNMHCFRNFREVGASAKQWLGDYSTEMPHEGIRGPTHAEFRQYRGSETSKSAWHRAAGSWQYLTSSYPAIHI